MACRSATTTASAIALVAGILSGNAEDHHPNSVLKKAEEVLKETRRVEFLRDQLPCSGRQAQVKLRENGMVIQNCFDLTPILAV